MGRTREGGGAVTLEYRIGDVRDRLAEIPDGSIDLVVSSPPFLALRSYLPADHPDKHREIGSEPTPEAFIDTLLGLTAEFGRVLAPHGSICIELGDTYSGSGGAGGDYNTEGLRDGQDKFKGSASRRGEWPLAKSLTGIPTLYTWSLAYGRNLLSGRPSPAGQWRIRNVIVWARPNPPVGALGDKFRPATSYITVACKGPKRYFDLDAVRTAGSPNTHARLAKGADPRPTTGKKAEHPDNNFGSMAEVETAGAPPLDWHADEHPEDGDWLWKLSTQPYAGSHYATFPMALPKRMIEAMCPQRVCATCGTPSTRITERSPEYAAARTAIGDFNTAPGGAVSGSRSTLVKAATSAENITLGWTDCGHDNYRVGVVLDPFAGSGTTLEAAQAVGRHAIGIDLDERNGRLARERVGMFLDVQGAA
jgi:site-specific DNA-methyltransferase (adenine-specific)